jgi:hypothetical protein
LGGFPAWSEEKAQAEMDIFALRILTCPLKACRRSEACTRSLRLDRPCPGLVAHPYPPELERARTVVLRFEIKRAIRMAEAGEEESRAVREAREAAHRRRWALAMERARAKVREMRRGG